MQSDNITFYACKIIKGTSGFNLKHTIFFNRWRQHPKNSWNILKYKYFHFIQIKSVLNLDKIWIKHFFQKSGWNWDIPKKMRRGRAFLFIAFTLPIQWVKTADMGKFCLFCFKGSIVIFWTTYSPLCFYAIVKCFWWLSCTIAVLNRFH